MRRTPSALIFALALAVPFGAAFLKGEIPTSDAALFEYYGRAIDHGSRLYLDVWDNKLPSIYLANAVLQALFGSYYRVHVLAEAAVAASSIALFARLLVRSRVAAWAPASLALALLLSVLPLQLDSVENFALPLILIAYLLALEAAWGTLAAGIAIALATTFWLPSLLLLVPLLDRERSVRGRVTLILAAACTLIVYVGAMLAVFGLPAIAELARSWVAYANMSFGGRARAEGRFGVLAPIFAGLVRSGAGLMLAAVAAVVRRPRDQRERFALVWTGCALFGALALGNFYEHYFIPLLPASIYALAVFGTAHGVRVQRVAFGAVALFFVWRTVTFDVGAIPASRADAHEKRLAAAHVRAIAGNGAVIDVDPYEPTIYLNAGAVGQDRFSLVPAPIRPPAPRPPATAVVLARFDADAERAFDPRLPTCARVGANWRIQLLPGAPPVVAARCRPSASP